MTDQGESLSLEGENNAYFEDQAQLLLLSCPCFQEGNKYCTIDRKDLYTESRLNGLNNDYYELSLSDIHVWYGKMKLDSPRSMLLENNSPFVQMSFSIRCNSTYSVGSDTNILLKMGHYQHNLLLIPNQALHVEWQKEMQLEVVTINVQPEFFFRYLPESLPFYSMFQQKIKTQLPAVLSNQNLPISPKIMTILYEIIHCQHKGCYKKLFIESKVIELLTIQLEQREHMDEAVLSPYSELKTEEIEKMHQAKEIILDNLENPLSLTVLARQIGTNVFNLKKHFKQVYGTTVFGFIHTYRMEQSKEMLKKGDGKIADIAKAAGYKHATHFTTAFKKYFGYLPNKLRN